MMTKQKIVEIVKEDILEGLRRGKWMGRIVQEWHSFISEASYEADKIYRREQRRKEL